MKFVRKTCVTKSSKKWKFDQFLTDFAYTNTVLSLY